MSPHLLVNGWFWGQSTTGSGQYLHGLLAHLPAALAGWQITLLRPRQAPPGLPLAAADAPLPPGLHEAKRDWPDRLRGPRLIKLAWEQIIVPQAARQLAADVLFTPYWGSPWRRPCANVVTIHDLIPLLLPDYATKITARAYNWLVSHSARRADAVLTVSQAAGADICRHLRIPPRRVHVTYEALGAPHAPVTDPQMLAAARQRYDLPPRYLFYLGGFDPRKNVPLLLQAYAQACALRPDLPPLLLAGKLPDPHNTWFDDPRPWIERLGLAGRVRSLGFVPDEDKPALYTLATLFLFPSRYEGFGLPPLEALACGTPALVSDSSSLPEVIGDTLPPVPAGDAGALARAMIQALDHPPSPRRLLAQAARFQWHDTARRTASVIQMVYNSR